ncbi:MAG: radical SAM protein [Nanoarchaeota archaeon]|nr:radical SAM protein [Nanoarchaeota archaeon]
MEKSNKITIISTESLALNGPRTLSSYLKKHGFFVQLISLSTFNDRFPDAVLDELWKISENSLLLCFSCMSVTSKKISQVISCLKPLGIPMVWGGIHATLNPEECLYHVDIVCRGEGEEALLDLAQALKNEEKITKIKNLWVKQDGKIYKNDVRPLIQNTDTLPFPDYNFESQYVMVGNKLELLQENHITYGEYNPSNYMLATVGHFITSHATRGCPYNCRYCTNYDLKKIYRGKGNFVRQRSIKGVVSDLASLRKKFPQLRFVWFTDDDFFLRDHEEISLFSKLYKEKVNLPFMCYVTPPSFTEDKLDLLVSAGLYIMEVGVQTGDQKFNQQVYNRGYANELLFKLSKKFNKYKGRVFPPVYQVMYMNPLEDECNTLQTIQLLRGLPRPFFLKIFNTVFFPGNAMYDKAKEELGKDIDLDKLYSFDYFDIFSHVSLKNKNLYLNLLIHYMARRNTKHRSGIIPNFMLGFLTSKRVIAFNRRFSFFTRLMLLIPTLSNIFWITPKKYKGKCLEVILMAERMKNFFRRRLGLV